MANVQACAYSPHFGEIRGQNINFCLHKSCIRRAWTQTAKNTTANQQLHGRGSNYRQNTTKTHKSHGHAFPLAKGLGMSTTILNLLATREVKLRRLLDQTPPSNSSSKHKNRICYTSNSTRNATTSEATTYISSNNSLNLRQGCGDLRSDISKYLISTYKDTKDHPKLGS